MVIFFDGSCGFCARQAEKLRAAIGPRSHIELVDLSEDPITCLLYDISYEDAMRELHGSDGIHVYTGADLLRTLLKEMGWRKTYTVLSLPLLRQLFSLSFWFLSKIRRWL